MTSEPKNETFLAAELAQVMPPVHAARTAVELCRIGRSYKRMAERLCGGEEQWGRWDDSVEKAQELAYASQGRRLVRARKLVAGLSVRVDVSGLILVCETTVGKGASSFSTALL